MHRDPTPHPQASSVILVILHRSCGDMGKIGDFFTRQGYTLDVRCVIEGDELPDPRNYRAVVIFGGTMSVNDTDEFPAMRTEAEWIPRVLEADIPYLGICLGAQLLSKACGGSVAPKADNSVEIGYHRVRPTNDDCNLFPADGLHFYQWHLEGFSIPDKATRLATSDCFPNQAFRINNAIGLQFHPEVTRDMIDCWVQREADNLFLDGAQSYKTQVELYSQCDNAVSIWLDEFLTAWLTTQQ